MTIVEALIRFETVCFEQRGAGVKPTMSFGFERPGTSKQLKILGGMQNSFSQRDGIFKGGREAYQGQAGRL
jgi:hypothetical protein